MLHCTHLVQEPPQSLLFVSCVSDFQSSVSIALSPILAFLRNQRSICPDCKKAQFQSARSISFSCWGKAEFHYLQRNCNNISNQVNTMVPPGLPALVRRDRRASAREGEPLAFVVAASDSGRARPGLRRQRPADRGARRRARAHAGEEGVVASRADWPVQLLSLCSGTALRARRVRPDLTRGWTEGKRNLVFGHRLTSGGGGRSSQSLVVPSCKLRPGVAAAGRPPWILAAATSVPTPRPRSR